MSIDVNTSRVKVGDKLVVTRDGRTNLMEVWSISAAGTGARAERHGPMIHAWIRPGGYGVAFDYSTIGYDIRVLGEGECEQFVADGSCIHSDHTP